MNSITSDIQMICGEMEVDVKETKAIKSPQELLLHLEKSQRTVYLAHIPFQTNPSGTIVEADLAANSIIICPAVPSSAVSYLTLSRSRYSVTLSVDQHSRFIASIGHLRIVSR